jgi:hypothetical protein
LWKHRAEEFESRFGAIGVNDGACARPGVAKNVALKIIKSKAVKNPIVLLSRFVDNIDKLSSLWLCGSLITILLSVAFLALQSPYNG